MVRVLLANIKLPVMGYGTREEFTYLMSDQEGIGPVEILDRVTMQVFVRDHCTMIAAPVQCDVDGITQGSHYVLLKRPNARTERCGRPSEPTTVTGMARPHSL